MNLHTVLKCFTLSTAQGSRDRRQYHGQCKYDYHNGGKDLTFFVIIEHIYHLTFRSIFYMFMPVLASCFILVGAIAIFGKKGENSMKEKLEKFQERERAANEVRRKPLDDLDYLTVPDEFLSFPSDEASHDATEGRRILESLKSEKIVNLTGLSNTDLKERYGVANLPDLMRFDQNYTSLVRALQMYAAYLSEAGYEDQAVKLLEYAVESRSDVSSSYRLLGKLYVKNGRSSELDKLIQKATELNSPLTASIVRSLEDMKDPSLRSG